MTLNDNSGRFDIKSALDRFSGDTELLGEAITIFKEDATTHLEAIKNHLEEEQVDKIVVHAHTLKGECGAVGAVTAQFFSGSLEKAAKNNDLRAALELYTKVEEEVQTAIEELPLPSEIN